MTLDKHIIEAKANVLRDHPMPPQPDYSLDLDVQRYNREVSLIHRLLVEAEQSARDAYVPPKKGGKNG